MIITKTYTRAQIEEMKRAEQEAYRQRQRQAPAKVRNAVALVALGEHRALRWRGHHYTVPPVPFRAGAKLYALRQSFGSEDAAAADLLVFVAQAKSILRGLVQRRRFARIGFIRNPFHKATLPELIQLIDGVFLYTPQDIEPILSSDGSAATVDLVDTVMEYLAAGFPAKDGLPITWQHYQYAIRHIGATYARAQLRGAQMTRVAQAERDDFMNWAAEMRQHAGWN